MSHFRSGETTELQKGRAGSLQTERAASEGSDMQLGHKRLGHTAHEHAEGVENIAADSLDAWITELGAALGVDATTIDHDQILEPSRATHRVARAAGPFTMLLVGMAAGRNGG